MGTGGSQPRRSLPICCCYLWCVLRLQKADIFSFQYTILYRFRCQWIAVQPCNHYKLIRSLIVRIKWNNSNTIHWPPVQSNVLWYPTTPLHQKSTTTLLKRRRKTDWTGLGHSRECGERDGTRYQSFYAGHVSRRVVVGKVVWWWGDSNLAE